MRAFNSLSRLQSLFACAPVSGGQNGRDQTRVSAIVMTCANKKRNADNPPLRSGLSAFLFLFGGICSLALTAGVFCFVHSQRVFAFSASLRLVFEPRDRRGRGASQRV